MSLLVELLIKGSVERFADVMHSITKFKTKEFVLSVKVLLLYNNKWVSTSSIIDRRFGLAILTFCKRDCLSFRKFE